MRKKRILFHSDASYAPTGFGGALRRILTYLYLTGKYELANFACGTPWTGDGNAARVPWKTYGAIPNHRPDLIQRMNQDPNYARMVSYGSEMIDEVIKDFKPDIYIGQQDIWAFDGYIFSKGWWNQISCAIHWTADSIPLADGAVNNAEKIKNHLVWATFAEKEFHRLALELEKKLDKVRPEDKEKAIEKIEAFKRVKTIFGAADDKSFYPLNFGEKLNLRHKYAFDEDTFIISTLSRNQLRKLFLTQIEAFAIFKKNNPKAKAKLIHWTSLEEGWGLAKSCEEHGIDIKDVLAAHRCRETGEIFYLPVIPGEKDNPKTGKKGSVKSCGLDNPAPEWAINEFYNLSDVFTLNITSGGAEFGALQAKLCGLPTILNSYSCFEDLVGVENGTLNVEESFTYECNSNFRKAHSNPVSLAKQFEKVYKMTKEEKKKLGENGRKLALSRYTGEAIGKEFEKLIDSLPLTDFDFSSLELKDNPKRNPYAQISNNPDNDAWILELYRNILGREPDPEGFKTWQISLQQGMTRQQVHQVFQNVANQENAVIGRPAIENFLDSESPDVRMLLTLPQSVGDLLMVSSLFKDARELYPNHKIYFACNPQYFEVLQPSVPLYLDKLIPFTPEMEQPALLEGAQGAKKYFDIVIGFQQDTQRTLNYYRGGKDESKIELIYK